MRTVYRDVIAAVLAVLGGVVVFAKINSFTWWLIGSWTGALGVLAVLGLAILLTNVVELWRMEDGPAITEFSLWLLAATVTVASLFVTTNKAEFIWSGSLIGFAWLAQTTRHIWRSLHTTPHHYYPAS